MRIVQKKRRRLKSGIKLILIDTSVWIDFLKSKSALKIEPNVIGRAVTTPIVIQEVFQGLKDNPRAQKFRDYFLSLPRFSDPTLLDDFLLASDIYGQARRKGLTIRSSADCLIAAIAIRNKLEIWHRDRDFIQIAKITGLKLYKSKD